MMGKTQVQNDESLKPLERKLQGYRQKRDELNEKLKNGYCVETLRELNIVEHHIRVCTERLTGQWYREDIYKDDIIIVK